MTFIGTLPLGALLFGIRLPALRILARPVYVERGLLPDFTRAEPE
jgi:hypothetical protein